MVLLMAFSHLCVLDDLLQVLAFNNKPIKNLKHLAEMVENYDGEFLQFDLEYQQVSLSLYLTHAHTHTHKTHTHTHTDACTHTHVQARMHAHAHACKHAHTRTHSLSPSFRSFSRLYICSCR